MENTQSPVCFSAAARVQLAHRAIREKAPSCLRARVNLTLIPGGCTPTPPPHVISLDQPLSDGSGTNDLSSQPHQTAIITEWPLWKSSSCRFPSSHFSFPSQVALPHIIRWSDSLDRRILTCSCSAPWIMIMACIDEFVWASVPRWADDLFFFYSSWAAAGESCWRRERGL